MPINKEAFIIVEDDLQKVIDVDDSRGRSCPINMNFVEEGYLSKDTGFTLFGDSESELCHSLFNYKKKDGTRYIIRGKGTHLERYSEVDRRWYQLGTKTFTEGAKFSYMVYDDNLYGCNGVDNYFKFDGTTFTDYPNAPKGNILEIFEDRMFVSGVTAQPLSVYYSKTGDPTDFTISTTAGGVIKPLGTDFVTNMKNFYGQMLIFKENTIWKVTFIYDSVVTLFVPKLELQSGNYGACSRKSVSWVENDIWFFTGREIRSIGYKDNQTGVLGVNTSVISEDIKETLYLIDIDNYSKCVVGYHNRRFYLSIPLNDTNTDTTFVCHLLYKSKWTKYTGRDKSKINDFYTIDNVIYTTVSSINYGVIKWDVTEGDTSGITRALQVNQ